MYSVNLDVLMAFLAIVRLPLWELEKGFDFLEVGGILWLVDGVVLDT